MAKDEIRNGQREYGIVHVNEKEMRANGDGVFDSKNAGGAPSNKADAPAADKETPAATMSQTKDELLAIARDEGVEVETDDNKADLVRKIEQARK